MAPEKKYTLLLRTWYNLKVKQQQLEAYILKSPTQEFQCFIVQQDAVLVNTAVYDLLLDWFNWLYPVSGLHQYKEWQ